MHIHIYCIYIIYMQIHCTHVKSILKGVDGGRRGGRRELARRRGQGEGSRAKRCARLDAADATANACAGHVPRARIFGWCAGQIHAGPRSISPSCAPAGQRTGSGVRAAPHGHAAPPRIPPRMRTPPHPQARRATSELRMRPPSRDASASSSVQVRACGSAPPALPPASPWATTSPESPARGRSQHPTAQSRLQRVRAASPHLRPQWRRPRRPSTCPSRWPRSSAPGAPRRSRAPTAARAREPRDPPGACTLALPPRRPRARHCSWLAVVAWHCSDCTTYARTTEHEPV